MSVRDELPGPRGTSLIDEFEWAAKGCIGIGCAFLSWAMLVAIVTGLGFGIYWAVTDAKLPPGRSIFAHDPAPAQP